MAVLLIVAITVIILNLALPGSSFDYMILLGIPFDCDTHWKYFCWWHFLEVLWTVILPYNPCIVILSDSILNMSYILSGSPLVFDTPCSTFACSTPLQSF